MGFYKRLLLSICLIFSNFYIFSMGQATSSQANRLAERRNFNPEIMYLDKDAIQSFNRIEYVAVLKRVIFQEIRRLPMPVPEDIQEPLMELPFANEKETPNQTGNTPRNFFDCCAQSYNQKPSE
jgi:hypothetical protein